MFFPFSPLYKEEQEIQSRRIVALLSYVLETSAGVHWFLKHEQLREESTQKNGQFIDVIYRICVLLDNAVSSFHLQST